MRTRTLVFSLVFHCFNAALAQNVTIPATNGSLPASSSNGCAAGYFPGTDTVLFTVPYNYTQVLSVIGNYTNLTWSGSPENSVTSNSTDWVPGTARFYDVAGAHVIETITEYEKPADGPYVETHTLAPLSVPSYNVSFYADFDGQVWEPVCDGKATATNFTINFCATNATTAAAVLHALHLVDAQTVGKFLGGMNFTSCEALGSNSTVSTTNGTLSTTNGTLPTTSGTGGSSGTSTGSGSSTASGGSMGTMTGTGTSSTAGATTSANSAANGRASIGVDVAIACAGLILYMTWL